MATIDECKKQTEFIAGKAGYNGYISPNDFILLFNKAQLQFFQRQYARYYATQEISDSLSVFLSDPYSVAIPNDGVFEIDENLKLLHIDSITHTYNGKAYPVVRVEKDRLANHLSSEYDAPDLQFPIYTQFKASIQFFPANLATASMVYLKIPTPVKWAYTLVSSRPVYDSVNSVHPEWKDTDIDNIINLILADLGVNMGDQNLQQYSLRKSQTDL